MNLVSASTSPLSLASLDLDSVHPQASPAVQPAEPLAAHQGNNAVPGRLMLNDKLVLIGSFKPLNSDEKTLLPDLFKPQGAIEETSLAHGGTQFSYPATASLKPDEPAHAYKVNLQVRSNGQLNRLNAYDISHPERNSEEGIAFSLNFEPPVSHLQNLPAELKLHIAQYTGKNGTGVDLALRQTSR
ncbi:hypothetical protein, partial [Pseudomonas asuensis]|uniref:hypothetical protein n=1 Tax=Pseudomonas asuensis TaxID=1825787 RepID=UPI00166EC559